MTVSSTTVPAIGTSERTTTVFPSFRILTASDLQVTVNGVAVTSGYSVTGVNEPAGGTVVFAVAPAASASLVLRRATPATQLLNLVDHDPEPAETIEQAHDKAVLLIQDMQERLTRTLSLEPTDGVAFPDPDDPANQNKAVFVNGSGEFEMRTMRRRPSPPHHGRRPGSRGRMTAPRETRYWRGEPSPHRRRGKPRGAVSWHRGIPLTLIDAKRRLIPARRPIRPTGSVGATRHRKAADGAGDRPSVELAASWRCPGATAPDGSGSGNAPPARPRVSTASDREPEGGRTSRGSTTRRMHLLWGILLPNNYGSGGTIRLKWKSLTATAGVAVWKAGVGVSLDGVTADSTLVFNAADLVTSTVPGTVTQLVEATLPLTMTNAAATRWMTVFLGRWASHASDTRGGDAVLVGARREDLPA
jgi:hypothetical protein